MISDRSSGLRVQSPTHWPVFTCGAGWRDAAAAADGAPEPGNGVSGKDRARARRESRTAFPVHRALCWWPSRGSRGSHRDNIHEWIRYEGFEHFEEGLRRGRGVLFATAHLGNWELSAFAHALLVGADARGVRDRSTTRCIDRLVERRRTLSGNRVIEKKDFARGILRALATNEAVGILIDQNSSLDEGVFVDFFGIPACAGAGFAKIAAHSGAVGDTRLCAVDRKRSRRYVLRFYPPGRDHG